MVVQELPGTEPAEPRPGARVQKVWIWQETSDCLWNMAKEHYGDPFLWPRIYEANRNLIKDPHVIFPKQQIVIPSLDEVRAAPAEPAAAGLPGVPARPAPAAGGAAPRRDKGAPVDVLQENRWDERRDFSKW